LRESHPNIFGRLVSYPLRSFGLVLRTKHENASRSASAVHSFATSMDNEVGSPKIGDPTFSLAQQERLERSSLM